MSVVTEKLRVTRNLMASIAKAIKSDEDDEDILNLFVDSCCFRQVISTWRDPDTDLDILQLVVLNKRLSLVKFLCKSENKFTPWRPQQDGQGKVTNSPFHLACEVGALHIIRFLLDIEEEYADMLLLRTEGHLIQRAQSKESEKPLLPFEICVREGHIDCSLFLCQFILSGCVFKDTPEKLVMLNASAVHQACHLGSGPLLSLLLNDPSWSRYINSYDSSGFTPLHVAAMCGDSECVDILLKHGANINVYADCRSVLHILYSYKKKPEEFVKCTKLLVSYGADVNASDHNENTPLDYVAYEFGQKVTRDQMQTLRAAYTVYDERPPMEKAPGMKSSRYRQELLETMKMLLESGAHTHTILSHTEDGNLLVDHTLIHTLLQNTGWPLSSCLMNNAQDVYRAMELLFRFGCDPNALAKHNLTSSFTTLILQSLHEVKNIQTKLDFLHLYISHGTNLECIIPPPRHFRKHPTERLWSVPPLMLALQEKHPMKIIKYIIDFMSLKFVNAVLRSAKMHDWNMYILQMECNKPYRKEWAGLKHHLRNNVRDLKHQCKQAILCSLKRRTVLIEGLPIPKVLKQYLSGQIC